VNDALDLLADETDNESETSPTDCKMSPVRGKTQFRSRT
jgi:hypothetical protein